MDLHTTLNDADVRVVYEIELDEVDCYDAASNSEYSKIIADFVIEAVWFQGVNIKPVAHELDLTALAMECEAHYSAEVAV